MGSPTMNFAGSKPLSFKAAGAILANRLLKLTAENTVDLATAITDNIIGVSLNAAAAGEYVDVLTTPGAKAKVTASAAIAVGAQVMPAAGAAGKCATAAGATAKSCGIALTAAAADGEVIEVLLRFSVNTPANV